MTNTIEGSLVSGGNDRYGIVVSRFNGFIGESLLKGALDGLGHHGVDDGRVDVVWVPGAFEIPLVANKMAEGGNYAAVICLGCVIRGATSHYEYVAGEAARGIASAARESGIPVIFGVLTTENVEQANERAGTKADNKGWEAALAAIEMVDVMRQLSGLGGPDGSDGSGGPGGPGEPE